MTKFYNADMEKLFCNYFIKHLNFKILEFSKTAGSKKSKF